MFNLLPTAMPPTTTRSSRTLAFAKRHRYALVMIGVLLSMMGLWGLWGKVGVFLMREWICGADYQCEKLASLGQVGDVFGGINAFFAAIALAGVIFTTDTARETYKREKQRDRDSQLTEQVQRSYSWAYAALTDDGKSMPPHDDARVWEMAARHLYRAEQLWEMVKSEEYKIILAEHREYWSHKFNIALDFEDLADPMYYVNIAAENLDDELCWAPMMVNDFANSGHPRNKAMAGLSLYSLVQEGAPFEGHVGSGVQAYRETIQRES